MDLLNHVSIIGNYRGNGPSWLCQDGQCPSWSSVHLGPQQVPFSIDSDCPLGLFWDLIKSANNITDTRGSKKGRLRIKEVTISSDYSRIAPCYQFWNYLRINLVRMSSEKLWLCPESVRSRIYNSDRLRDRMIGWQNAVSLNNCSFDVGTLCELLGMQNMMVLLKCCWYV